MAVDQMQVLTSAIRAVAILDSKDARIDELAEAIGTLIDVKIATAYQRGLYDGYNGGYPGGTTKTLANLKE